ncbi:MAG: alpha/beta fold hydrolase [Bacillota bacterium]|nr:MAG: alpha/beta fold hydrolase [Bacillota bacterium]
MSFVDVRGDRFHYIETGEGEAVLLLHPSPLDHTVWFNQVPAFSSDYRVIALDQRCFGLSEKTTTPFDISIYGEDTALFLEALGIDRAHVIGTSLGGIAAQFFAIAHPARVGRMVLVSTTSSLVGVDIAAKRLKGFAEDGLAGYHARAVRSLFSEAYASSAHGEYLISLLAKRVKYLELDSMVTFYNALAALDITPAAVRGIGAPTLVVAGTEDFTFNLSRRVAETIPGARFIPAEGCGRLVPVEAPRMFNDLVLSFLSTE